MRVKSQFNSDREFTFTQRGKLPDEGFIRYKGKTVGGFIGNGRFGFSGMFYSYNYRPNGSWFDNEMRALKTAA